MSKLIMVSSCLAGINCRYDGGNNRVEEIAEMVASGKAIPVCPEVYGGLSIPRGCCEIVVDEKGQRIVKTKEGEDYTMEFEEGAKKTLEIAKVLDIDTAILQQRSPSCGYGKIYDGSFSRKLIEGNGVAAELFSANGIKVYNDQNFKDIFE